MNLHGIVSGAIGAINPLVAATLQRSTGYTIKPDGTQVPQYATFAAISCQIQQLTEADLQRLDSLNQQGVHRKVWLNGQWRGVVRADQVGGDLLVMADNSVWLVVAVLEQWPDWASLAITQQNGA